ncbi:MAG: hypothetical protein ACRDWN_04520, partial [Acidimicrobiales bacterium]
DLHRRRSVIVQRSAGGETLAVTQVTNDDVVAFAKAVTDAGERIGEAEEKGWLGEAEGLDRPLQFPAETGTFLWKPTTPPHH